LKKLDISWQMLLLIEENMTYNSTSGSYTERNIDFLCSRVSAPHSTTLLLIRHKLT
jgi:hypothetical protein